MVSHANTSISSAFGTPGRVWTWRTGIMDAHGPCCCCGRSRSLLYLISGVSVIAVKRVYCIPPHDKNGMERCGFVINTVNDVVVVTT